MKNQTQQIVNEHDINIRKDYKLKELIKKNKQLKMN